MSLEISYFTPSTSLLFLGLASFWAFSSDPHIVSRSPLSSGDRSPLPIVSPGARHSPLNSPVLSGDEGDMIEGYIFVTPPRKSLGWFVWR